MGLLYELYVIYVMYLNYTFYRGLQVDSPKAVVLLWFTVSEFR